jgi:hypothetical protein
VPIHSWRCDPCGAELEVLRKVGDEAEPPSAAEVTEAGVAADCGTAEPDEEPRPHFWRKQIKGAPAAIKGPSWGSGKGHW